MQIQKCLLAFLLWVLFQSQGMAQCDIKVKGLVLDEHNKMPLSSVLVENTTQQQFFVTDGKGFFEMNVCKGSLHLKISYIHADSRDYFFEINSDTTFTLLIEQHVEMLKEVDIHHEKNKKAKLESNCVNEEEVHEGGTKSISQILESVTGVTTLKSGNSDKPVIHGMHSNRLAIVSNGGLQEDQQWGAEHSPQISTIGTDHITVLKGVKGLEYSPVISGGVIFLESDPIEQDSLFHGYLNAGYSSNGKGGTVSTKIDKRFSEQVGARAYGSYKKLGDLSSAKYLMTNTGVTEYNAGLQLQLSAKKWQWETNYDFLHSTIGILKSAHIGNITDFNLALENEKPFIVEEFSYAISSPRQVSDHHSFKNKWVYDLKNNQKLIFRINAQWNQRQEYDIRRVKKSDLPSQDIGLSTQEYVGVYQHKIGENVFGKLGLSFTSQRNLNVFGTGVRPILPNYSMKTYSLFLIEKKYWEKSSIEFGGRYNFRNLRVAYFSQQDELIDTTQQNGFLSAGVHYNKKITKSIDVDVQLNYSERAPHVIELYSDGLHHGAAAIEIGKNDLRNEKALNSNIEINTIFKDKWKSDVSFYFNYFQDFIYTVYQDQPILTVRGVFPVLEYTQTNALIYGLDYDGEYPLTSWLVYNNSLGLIFNRDLATGGFLNGIPTHRIKNNLEASKQDWKGLKKMSVTLEYIYVAKQNHYNRSAEIMATPDAYQLLNAFLRVEKKINNVEIHLKMGVENILNQRYRDYLDRWRYYTDSVGRNVFVNLHFTF